MKTRLVHFYWVAQGNGLPPGTAAWHVAVVDELEPGDDFSLLGGEMRRDRMLNVTQAEAEGIDLTALKQIFDTDLAGRLEIASALAHQLGESFAEAVEALEKAKAKPKSKRKPKAAVAEGAA